MLENFATKAEVLCKAGYLGLTLDHHQNGPKKSANSKDCLGVMIILTTDALIRKKILVFYDQVEDKKNQTTISLLRPVLQQLNLAECFNEGLLPAASDQVLESFLRNNTELPNHIVCLLHTLNRNGFFLVLSIRPPTG